MRVLIASLMLCGGLPAQEANSGFEIRTTLSAGGFFTDRLTAPPRDGALAAAGARAVFYPSWKLSRHWTVAGTYQTYTRPYFYEQLNTQGHGLKGDLLQAHLSYSQFWKNGSLVVRAGQLSSAFGSFLLHYDDMANPLIDMPVTYGYYYKPITTLGQAGAQADLTVSRLDLRAQFVNSSPANRRSVFDSDQYGTWAGGAGVTLTQGFRVGVSAYRGPYLHRGYAFYRAGEAKPRDLPGSAYGLDVEWARGHWDVTGEWQKFQRAYRAVPFLNQHSGYAEVRRVLHPRWYVAARAGYARSSRNPANDIYEFTVGYRPNARQLLKAGYQIQHGPASPGATGNTFAVQLVTTLRLISIAKD